jgi:hypothetical protein
MASDDWHIEIRDSASDADTAELRPALHEYNFVTTGYRDGRDLACLVRDNGRLVAGLAGFTWGATRGSTCSGSTSRCGVAVSDAHC